MAKLDLNVEEALKLHQEGRAHELHGTVDSKLVKAAVYGANDGIITTFAVVAGVAGAGFSPAIILVLGFANLIGDGISMGIGDYLGERSEDRFKQHQSEIEKWEIHNIPSEESKELKHFFKSREVSDEDAKKLSATIQKYPKLWGEMGFLDEMGELPKKAEKLWQSGVVTIIAFGLAGLLPLLPYIIEALGGSFGEISNFHLSMVSTALTLFFIGSLRTIVTKGHWWKNGLEMLFIGAIAAAAAYATGAFVERLI